MKIFFSAGDVSGDMNTARIISTVKAKYPDAILRGLGGQQMQNAGFVSDFEFSKFNKMGYWEVIKNLPFFLSAQKKFIKMMRDEKPDLLVCVDFSGFNKKLVAEANKLNIKVLWFIAPMIWAWKRAQYIKFFQKNPAHIACIFPFEPKFWQPEIKTVSFVGNPLLENLDFTEFPAKDPINLQKSFSLALIPGSREQEVQNILPFMLECAAKLKNHYNMKVIVSRMPSLPQKFFDDSDKLGFESETDFNKIIKQANIALVASGTATLHVGLASVPHIILYRTSPITFAVFKMFIKKKPLIGLSNIIAEKEVCPEFVQDEMITENVVAAVENIVKNPSEYEKTTNELLGLRTSLGEKKASVEVVKLIEKLI